MQYRKSFDAQVSEVDVPRIRGFIKNEISFYNVLLAAFSSRVRTMPDIFMEITPEIIEQAVTVGVDRKNRSISERVHLFLEQIAVQQGNLLPGVRIAMAKEMLETYRRLADALKKQTRAVELLSPMEERTKRNLQVPRESVTLDGSRLTTPYTKAPITFKGRAPDRWDILIVRDQDAKGDWKVEFAQKAEGYDLRLTEPPVRAFKQRQNNRPDRRSASAR